MVAQLLYLVTYVKVSVVNLRKTQQRSSLVDVCDRTPVRSRDVLLLPLLATANKYFEGVKPQQMLFEVYSVSLLSRGLCTRQVHRTRRQF